MPFNLARNCLEPNLRERGDKTALIIAGDGDSLCRLTFSEIDEKVRRLAAGFASLGLERGARVMIRMGNDENFAIAFFAAIAAGLVALPTSAQLTLNEARFLGEDSDAALIALGPDQNGERDAFGGRMTLDAAAIARLAAASPADYAPTQADDPAYMVYTSGTTSRPKGVVHAHRAILGRRPMHDDWLGLRPDDVMLHAGAVNWTFTLGVGLMDPWAVGATGVLYNGARDPKIWPRLIERFGATIFAAAPGVYRQMLKSVDLSAFDLSTLRHGVTAGEALRPKLLDQWRAATALPLYEALGMSEISTYISSRPGEPIRPGSPGRPQSGRRVAILPEHGGEEPLPAGEEGLLAVHRDDPSLMIGYWRRPDDDARARRGQWFIGGDLAMIDADGFVWYRGRADDVMNSFGYRVSPLEVEEALALHPDVADVAVAETKAGELSVITAFVVPRDGTLDEQALRAFCAQRLAAYKQPKRYIEIAMIPRGANGKLDRKGLARGVANAS